MEVQGTLDPNADNGNRKNKEEATKNLPIKALAELAYDERRIEAKESRRFYHEASAKIEVANRGDERRLRDDLRNIVCKLDDSKPLLYSPNGAFERNELELVTVPFNSLFVDQLLPNKKVKRGFEWTHQNETLALLLGVDAVTAGEIKSKVAAIDKDVVRLEMDGSIVAAVDGVVTDLDVDAKYNFDRKSRRINWVAAKIKERRAAGAASPSFDVLARIRMFVSKSKNSKLTTQKASENQLSQNDAATLLEHRSKDKGFSFLHDRRWHVINEAPNSSILRMIDDGETVAQCNIRTMKVDPKNETTLEHFKKEILQGLKKTQPQIADATTLTNSSGLRILRVQVLGTVSESPVQWIYYHAASKQGLGLTYSFTMSADAAEKFQATDHDITNSLRISNTILQSSIRSAVAR